MTIAQRKQREKEQFTTSVIQAAYGLVKEVGLEGLSLRKLAAALSYSTSKLYHEFGSKQELLVLLAEDICRRQNMRLAKLEKNEDPEKHLLQVTREAMCFYAEQPWAAGILAAVRFNSSDKTEVSPAFKIAAEYYRSCVVALNLSALSTSETLEEGLNVTRVLMLGALSILRSDSEETTKELVVKIVDDGMRLIIAGWKSLSK